MADVRFVGTDGPRWMLRGVLSGAAAADPGTADVLAAGLPGHRRRARRRRRSPRSEPLPLHLPDQAQAGSQPAPGADRRRLDPEGTGQRIAEIR